MLTLQTSKNLLLHIPANVCRIIIAFVPLSTQNDTDDSQIQLAGGDVELPKELAKMIEEDNEEEEGRSSVIGQLGNIQNLDLDSIKGKAQSTLDDLKQSAEKCSIM